MITDSTIRNVSEAVNRTLNGKNRLLNVVANCSSYRITIDEEDGYYSFYKGKDEECGGRYDTWREAYDALIKEKVQPKNDGYMPKIVWVQSIDIVTEQEVK